MKKFSFLMLIALAVLGFTSCASESNDGDDSTTNTTTPDASTTTPTPEKVTPSPNAPIEPDLPPSTVSFSSMKHDFGQIKEGDVASHTFKFTNTGDKPLKIYNVKPSCGCTTPKWTKDEVAPGADGEITVEFNSKNKKGKQNKSVTVTMNTEKKQEILTFTGEVQEDPNKPKDVAPATPPAPAQ